jgi:hypothetical protein
VSSFEPSKGADEVQGCEEIAGGFLISRRDASELFDVLEEALDQIALGIEREIAGSFDFAVLFGRDDGFDVSRLKARDKGVCVVALVAEEGFGLDFGGQRLGLFNVMNLSAGETQGQRISQGVGDDMDLGGQAASRSSYRLVETPFFRAPALC